MFDLVSSNPMIQAMDKSMTLASRRMGLIASNLANIDTPGYRTQDFSFQEALKRELASLDGQPLGLAQTHAGHMQPSPGGGVQVASGGGKGAYERNDGNDVNLDQQTMLLSRTQGNYSLSSSFAQVEMRRIYQIIREGAK